MEVVIFMFHPLCYGSLFFVGLLSFGACGTLFIVLRGSVFSIFHRGRTALCIVSSFV